MAALEMFTSPNNFTALIVMCFFYDDLCGEVFLNCVAILLWDISLKSLLEEIMHAFIYTPGPWVDWSFGSREGNNSNID